MCLGTGRRRGHISDGQHRSIPGNTYTPNFLTGGKILWGCRCWLVELLEGRERSQILPVGEGHDLPGGSKLCFVLFRFYNSFWHAHTLPCAAGLFNHSCQSCCTCQCSILRNAPASWALAYPAQENMHTEPLRDVLPQFLYRIREGPLCGLF